ncbi:MAG TPA: TonB-dependent receptor [Steroidobacteraceae bacterium]|nr:TonB-dependent receptor [Steroidobacteraceae bacterium]
MKSSNASLLISTAVNATLLAAAPGAFAQQAQNTRNVTLEEVIVTAQKRQEALQDVPQSITVLNSATFDRQQANNLQDYLALVPGLSLEASTRGVSRITLRGINTGGVASTVGVYVDETPFGSSSGLANGAILAGDFDTFDMTRLEVLRGPQGTLYGASSLGGVMKFVTNPPQTESFEGKAQVGIEDVSGGDMSYSGASYINVPLSDRFAIRATGFYRQDGGFVDSVGNNPIPSLLDPNINIIPGSLNEENINKTDSFGGRVSALFNATDAFSLRLTAILQNINSDSSDTILQDRETLKPLYGDRVDSPYHHEPTDIAYRLYSATIDWDLGPASLMSSTSYGTFEENLFFGQDRQFAALVTFVYGDAEDRPLGVIVKQTTATDKFTQELRLASAEDETLEWMVGAYYTKEKSRIDPQDFYATEGGSDTIAADIPRLIEVFLTSEYEEYAGFANLTWHISPRFDLTFGGRESHNSQFADQLIDLTALGVPLPDPPIPRATSSEDVFTWSVAPRFEISDDVSIYARVATGYRPGGPNILPVNAPAGTPATYKSDSLTSYEAGIKGSWFERALSLDFAAYYLDWEDIQLFANINDTGVNANGGTAVSKGVEFTLATVPTEGLTVSLNGAYTDAYLTKPTDPVVGGLNGDKLPFVPKLSLNLDVDYQWPVFSSSSAYVGASVRSIRDQVAAFDLRNVDGSQLEVPDYEVIDLRCGLLADRWSIELYVKNLDDELGRTSLSGAIGTYPDDALISGVIRPRTIGLSATVGF